MAQVQDNRAGADRRRVFPASNLFGFPNDTLLIDTPYPARPLLAWPPTAKATVTPTGALHVVERGRVVRRFATGEWITVRRLNNIRAEHRSVVVVDLRAGEAA